MTKRERNLSLLVRGAQVDQFIREQGLKRLDYMGPSGEMLEAERRDALRRSLNRSGSLRQTGRGPNPKRDAALLPDGRPRAGRRPSVAEHVDGWPELLALARARTSTKR